MRALAALLIVAGACGDDAAHIALPHVVAHGGRVLDTLDLVTITYPDDPLGDDGAAFDDDVVHSHWLDAVGREYGVFGGAHLAHHVMPAPAGATITYAQLDALPGALIAAGVVPGPTHGGVPILYVIYLPATTQVTDDHGMNPMCVSGLAYHAWAGDVPYAVVPTCYPGSQVARTQFASHEIIEAATDPFGDGWYADPADANDPLAYYQPEVADLCNRAIAPTEDGFTLEASWSNAEADAWRVRPCQPAGPADVYTMVAIDPAVIDAAAGETVHVTLTGFASDATDDWPLFVKHGYAGTSVALDDAFAASAVLDAPAINAGRSIGLALTVPPDAAPGTIVSANVWSRTTWNLLVVRVR